MIRLRDNKILVQRVRACTVAHFLVVMGILFSANILSGQVKSAAYSSNQLVVIPGEPVMVTRFGIYPQKLVRPEGPFVLFVENRLPGHTEHFSLTLDQNGAAELLGMDSGPQKIRNSILLDLMPGHYRLHLQNNSQLSVAIEIQAK
jgi:hypothetical protein